MTPLKLGEFFLAYFVGALKVTFLDAYLGATLTSAALGTDDHVATKGVVLAETVGIVAISLIISQIATSSVADMMASAAEPPAEEATASDVP